MAYKLMYSMNAQKQLDKLDPSTAKVIVKWMDANVNGSENPRSKGKHLKGDLSDYWRYRVGKNRVICSIFDDRLIVLAVSVGNRGNIYSKEKGRN